MTYSKAALFFLLVIIFSSCALEPQTKEDYMSQYASLIEDFNIDKELTKADWERIEKKHDKLTGENFDKFKDQLSWQETLKIGTYELKYNLAKLKMGSTDFFDDFVKGDTTKMKEQLKYYAENDMKKDIDFIVEQAKEVGSVAAKTIGKMLEELKEDLEELEENKK